MNTYYQGLTFQHQSGAVTTYDLQEVQHGNGPHIYVASESPVNQGPGFENGLTSGAVARDASARIQAKDNVEPHQVNLYQQKPNGDFDRVDFRNTGHHGVKEANQGQDWSESRREVYTRSEVQKELQSDLYAAPETPQQLQQQQRQEQQLQDLSAPQGLNRSEVSAQERTQLQDQVNRTQEQQKQTHRY